LGSVRIRASGHLPGERRGVDLVQRGHRHVHGDAVAVRARFERVRQRQREPARLDVVGVRGGVDTRRLCRAQHLLGEEEQVRLPPRLLLPPRVEVPAGDDVRRDALLVERDERLLVGHEVASPGAVSQFLDVLEQLAVGVEEAVPGVPVALDERVPDEQLARRLGVDPAEVDVAADDDRDAVQRDALDGDGGGAFA
jgi:hypothetical protein